jgi:hypothetical protein
MLEFDALSPGVYRNIFEANGITKQLSSTGCFVTGSSTLTVSERQYE